MTRTPGNRSGGNRSRSWGQQGSTITALQSFRRLSSTTNPYVAQLVGAMPEDVVVVPFSWRLALGGRYDVFHVQWPELLVRGNDRRRTALRRIMFASFLLSLRIRRIPVVRTVHNVEPHEHGGFVERKLLREFDRLTTLWVTLNDDTPLSAGRVRRTIVHGHYREWFADHPRADTTDGHLLYFGLIRSYKGVQELVDIFRRLPDPGASLRIVGKPSPAALGEEIVRTSVQDPRITTALSYVSDAELAGEITASELVVLPYLEIHNSGSLLLALSLDRPVLVPDAPTTRALRDEVGPEWVLLYSAPLTVDGLRDALARAALPRSAPHPDLSRREWASLGLQFADAYREALRLARGRRRYSE